MSTAAARELLEAQNVRVQFEGVRAIDGVELSLRRGEIVGLIGPNGAGKTTLLNVLSGFQPPTTGSVWLDGREVTGLVPARRAKLGLGRTFQGARLFGNLSVIENIELGAVGVDARGGDARRLAWKLIDRLGLRPWAGTLAASLPHGAERRLGIARALAMRPRYLLLDEPAAGLNEAESDELVGFLGEVRDEHGVGLLVIEHDMRLIMRLCERIQVLDDGRTIAVGPPGDVRRDPEVLRAYLGAEYGGDGAPA